MENKEIEKEFEDEFKKLYPCIVLGCNGDGYTIIVSNEEPEQCQCEYCYTVRYPLQENILHFFLDKIAQAEKRAECKAIIDYFDAPENVKTSILKVSMEYLHKLKKGE